MASSHREFNQLVQAYRPAKRQSFNGMVYRAAAVIISKALVHMFKL
jgi:type II secretory pathway component PulL